MSRNLYPPLIDGGTINRAKIVKVKPPEPPKTPRNIDRRPIKLPEMRPIREPDRLAYEAYLADTAA